MDPVVAILGILRTIHETGVAVDDQELRGIVGEGSQVLGQILEERQEAVAVQGVAFRFPVQVVPVDVVLPDFHQEVVGGENAPLGILIDSVAVFLTAGNQRAGGVGHHVSPQGSDAGAQGSGLGSGGSGIGSRFGRFFRCVFRRLFGVDERLVRGLVDSGVIGVILRAVCSIVRIHEHRNLGLLGPGLAVVVHPARGKADNLTGYHLGALEFPHRMHLVVVQGALLGETAPEVHHVHGIRNTGKAESGRIGRTIVAEEDVGDGVVALFVSTEGCIIVVRVLQGRLHVKRHGIYRTAGESADREGCEGQGNDCLFHRSITFRNGDSCPTTDGCRHCLRHCLQIPGEGGRCLR